MQDTIFSEFLTCRLLPSDMAVLDRLARAYGLRSRSEAVRRAVRQVAVERSLINVTELESPGQPAGREGHAA